MKLPLKTELAFAKLAGVAAALRDEDRPATAKYVEDAAAELRAILSEQVQALTEAEDYFDNRADADCVGDPPRFVGNEEMRLLSTIRELT